MLFIVRVVKSVFVNLTGKLFYSHNLPTPIKKLYITNTSLCYQNSLLVTQDV